MLSPEYACAIISYGDSYLFEQRDADARFAANKLTCFGGRLENDEDAQTGLLRELQEELDWQPSALSFACSLKSDTRYIADFFTCNLDVDPQTLHYESGRHGVLIPKTELKTANLSPWHQAVFQAIAQGLDLALI